MASLPEYLPNNNFQIPGVTVPGKDPRFQQVLQGQKESADAFKKKLPEYQGQLGAQYEKDAKRNLAENMKQVKKDYNSRGLLRSGGRLGKEAQATASTGFDIAQGRYGINQALANQADALEDQYLNTAYSMAGNAPNIGSGLLQNQQNAINDQLASNAALNDIFGGAGRGLGYIFSKYNK